MVLINTLYQQASRYLEPEKIKGIHRAYQFGVKAHAGQRRASGEPYIHHPVAVASILVEMRMDYSTIIAAILHDVIEDTPTAKDHIVAQFGDEIANLVDGVTKLDKVSFQNAAEHQAENVRKMVMAMVGDIRVILIKLADRLHNMRTLLALRREKRRKIALETLEVYAPIANRLGLRNMRSDLEELSFRTLYPLRYRVFAQAIKHAASEQESTVNKALTAIEQRLQLNHITARIRTCTKHPYSVYRKRRTRQWTTKTLFNAIRLRINVSSVNDCYLAMGAIHGLYRPVFNDFKDYIALPKTNGYQSLHTRLISPYGTLSVQICTEDMDTIAEHGVVARWLYDDDRGQGAHTRAMEWLHGLHDLHNEANDSIEFFEHVRTDLFPHNIYVFTPNGEIKALPQNATAVDFAYSVHTDIGNRCIGAKIDGDDTTLHTPLEAGQTIEIVTAPWGRPNAAWLNFVATAKARAGIRGYLKRLRKDEAIEVGKQLLKQALANKRLTLDDIASEHFDTLSRELSLEGRDALLEEIGIGKRPAAFVVERLTSTRDPAATPHADLPRQPVIIRGAEGQVVQLGKCCYPIPGDRIVGIVNPKRGIMIHTARCYQIANPAHISVPWVDVDWEPDLSGTFPVDLRVYVENCTGALATVAKVIADQGVNIAEAKVSSQDGVNSGLDFVLDVTGRDQLARIMRHIHRFKSVSRVVRTHEPHP